MKNKRAIVGIAILALGITLKAQNTIPFSVYEDTLTTLCRKIWKAKDDSSRLAANAIFLEKYKSTLSLHSAFNHPFDSLSGISKLKSGDGKIRISTWNVPLNNGTFRYYGFIEVNDGHLYILRENDSRPADWENRLISYDNWYGAVYYKLITVYYNKEVYYTLLGWDGNNNNSNFKMIDILIFNNSGIPGFGKAIFKTPDGTRNRVVIEYSEKSSALLRYDYQTLIIQKRNGTREKKAWMIVTDKLIPMLPTMQGIRKYYVPSGDTYDAYIFNEGFWNFVENVKVANNMH